MNKPLTMMIKETKLKLVDVCNKSMLPPTILDLIMQGIYSEIHSLAEKQSLEEEVAYTKAIKETDINNVDLKLEGDFNESQ